MNLYLVIGIILIKILNALESLSISESTVKCKPIPCFILLHGRMRLMHVLGYILKVQFTQGSELFSQIMSYFCTNIFCECRFYSIT